MPPTRTSTGSSARQLARPLLVVGGQRGCGDHRDVRAVGGAAVVQLGGQPGVVQRLPVTAYDVTAGVVRQQLDRVQAGHAVSLGRSEHELLDDLDHLVVAGEDRSGDALPGERHAPPLAVVLLAVDAVDPLPRGPLDRVDVGRVALMAATPLRASVELLRVASSSNADECRRRLFPLCGSTCSLSSVTRRLSRPAPAGPRRLVDAASKTRTQSTCAASPISSAVSSASS